MTNKTQQPDVDKRPEEEEVSRPDRLWFGWSGFAWAMGISVLLHALCAAPFLIWEFAPSAKGLDASWVEQFEELQGIGHGASAGRWAEIDSSALQENSEPVVEPESEVEPEPEPEPEPEAEVELEPEPEPEAEVEPEPEPDEPPVAEKLAQVEPEPASTVDSKPEARPKKAEKPAQKPAKNTPFTADKPLPGLDRAGPSDIPNLKHYGPGNARVTALVRLDRVRGTIYEDGVRQVMRKVPDFRLLAEHTGFDPVDDIDSFFMASARPQYLQESFLAVRHHHSRAEIKAVLDRRFRDPIAWEARGEAIFRPLVPQSSRYQDPRRVMLARPGLAIVGKEAWLEQIAENLPADSALREGEQAAGGSAPAQATMLDGLAQIERVAEKDDTMALMSAQGLIYRIPGLGRMRFEGVRLKLSNPASPTLDVDLKFKDAEEARRFSAACPTLRARLKKSLGLDGLAGMAMRAMGLGGIIDKLQCRAEAEYVNIHAVFSAQQLRSIAGVAGPLIPQPRALYQLPPPPPPPPPPPAPKAPGALGTPPGGDAGGAADADGADVDKTDPDAAMARPD